MTKNPTIKTGESVSCFGDHCVRSEEEIEALLNSPMKDIERKLRLDIKEGGTLVAIKKTLKWVLKKK